MKDCQRCPLCASAELHLLKRQTFELPAHLRTAEAPAPRDADEERLWIYFHRLLKQTSPATIAIVKCQHCGFIFTNPRPEQADIEEKYRWVARLGADQKRHRDRPPQVNQRGARIFRLLQPLLDRQQLSVPAAILDYGGAEGYLLLPFIERGHRAFLADYMNYSPASPAIEYLGKDLSDIDPEARFDLILLLHTLEHVVDPVGMIQALAERLTPRGLLYIEVPLGAWLEWNSLREPITHLNFFSEQSLYHATQAADLHPIALDTAWQQVVHAHAMPCINLVATRELATGVEPVTEFRSTDTQLQPWHQAIGGLQHNPRYYGKELLRGLATRLR